MSDQQPADAHAREQRYRGVVERVPITNTTPAMEAALREVAEQNEFIGLAVAAQRALADIEDYRETMKRFIERACARAKQSQA